MHPQLKILYLKFEKKMGVVGIRFKVTNVARTYKEQIALYAQGRETLNRVNEYRKLALLGKISNEQNKFIVTYTLNSKHIINTDDSESNNDLSRAFDIVLFDKNMKITYDLKANINLNEETDYLEAAKIGKSVGLNCGAFFKNVKGELRPDFPHYEI
ncbi:MAG TPA: hypothetical protein VI911_10965 [Patescibacteria group bacterium]|nr:hypothetical protein [Patescibacteria group bacterium]